MRPRSQGGVPGRAKGQRLPRLPRVFFEEWDDPLISGIGWVSELIGWPAASMYSRTLRRTRAGPLRVREGCRRAPDIIVGSWCGKKFRRRKSPARPGWTLFPPCATAELHEIKSPIILQPGPAALTDGLDALESIVASWTAAHSSQRRAASRVTTSVI